LDEVPVYGGSERGFANDPQYGNERGYGDQYGSERGFGSRVGQYKSEGMRLGQELGQLGSLVYGGLEQKAHQYSGKYLGSSSRPSSRQGFGPMSCQILRSCTKWSNGTPTEKSIQNAYIDVIEKSQHFVYIENQFFITATGDKQKPVKNLIGKALVDRIVRAARNNEKYKVIVLIPAAPAFAGDLRDEGSLGTRAIMEFQYASINRGGNSIMEMIAKAGINPLDYIRFYNLRNYDRINAGGTMTQAEQQSGVKYEDARRQHDDIVGAGYGGYGEGTGARAGSQPNQYQQYQAAAQSVPKTAASRWDTVSECYMLGGEDIRNVPWDGSPESELNAFVSEELYIHSKVRYPVRKNARL
jgi:phospholipase D1/2